MATYVKAHYSQGQFIISSERVLPSLRVEGINSETYFSDEGAHSYTIDATQVINFMQSENIISARVVFGSPVDAETIDLKHENFLVPENKLSASVGSDHVYLFMDADGNMCFTLNQLPSGYALFRSANLVNLEQTKDNIKVTLDVYSNVVTPANIQLIIGENNTEQSTHIATAVTSTFDMGQSIFKSRVISEFSPVSISKNFDFTPQKQPNGEKVAFTFWLNIDQDQQDIQNVTQALKIDNQPDFQELYLSYDQQNCLLAQPALTNERQLTYSTSFVPKELQIQLAAYQAKNPTLQQQAPHDKPIILIMETVNSAHDNGSVMFNYLNRYYAKQFDTYYVLAKDSSERDNIERYDDHIIDFQTPRHLELFLMADAFLYTHFVTYLMPFDSEYLMQKIIQTPKIDLQHGIAGLKAQPKDVKPLPNTQIVVSSDREANFVKEEFDYTDKQILLTGMPRFDGILRNRAWSSFKARRHVLIMPTRRRKLINLSDDDFKESTFYQTYMSLINSPELKKLADKKHLHISFALHPAMQQYMPLFTSKFVKVMKEPRNDLQNLLRRNQVMITDYSSISFDFALQNRPVIYYQFDQLVENRHFEIDPHDIVGPVVDNESDLIMALKNAIRQEHLTPAQRSQLPENIYKQMDTHARKRVAEAVKNLFK
ncbi:CDP-glycerol glycerophosphotransferase (TagB/SpsB family) [Weissella uvarum]|uniref:CDP-glycerol glycerophosphotransferase family protein n=1 Tax=Weissella uvarum TaxID=1479233 RepID=UPI001960A4F6|nr:CDP-glycerol glycerophosphotransferase family protein [Weissella uvarum]MBM7616592.1 CDP-glycerol glycerophosphotransferase (TagB/SpsB family) [Weissella uvarum]MCM0594949.1 CDP-glycerol glycerophosphotransferase family protein [Weissella uvarum]